jgi:hypothetical protein
MSSAVLPIGGILPLILTVFMSLIVRLAVLASLNALLLIGDVEQKVKIDILVINN